MSENGAHEEKKTLTRNISAQYGGETKMHRLCLWGFMLAERHGFDIQQVEMDQTMKHRHGDLNAVVEILWIARLPFEPDLTLEDYAMDVSFQDIPAVMSTFDRIMSTQVGADVREYVDEQKRKKKASPKPDSTTSKPSSSEPSGSTRKQRSG